jgi:cysteine-rich repeat protein
MHAARVGALLSLSLLLACKDREANDVFCGDGAVNQSEEVCDDGNNASGDGCRADCAKVEECGDGITDTGEECDDANELDGDGCRPGCFLAACGDGLLDAGESCDDGNSLENDGCSAGCQLQTCGNGTDDAGELCFSARQLLAAGAAPFGLVSADLDGDGDLDLAAADLQSAFHVFFNDGTGSFGDAQTTTVDGAVPFRVAAGDLDQDGDLDLIATENGFDANDEPTLGAVLVLLNDGAGNFAFSARVATEADLLISLAVADLNGDTFPEVITQGLNGKVSIFPNQNGQLLDPNEIDIPEQFFFGSQPFSVATGDLDGDDDIDIFVGDGGSLVARVLFNDGNANFTLRDGIDTGIGAFTVALGDADGDGDLDGLVLNQGLRSVAVLFNPGDGFFDSRANGIALAPNDGSFIDLDGDAAQEILALEGGDVFGGAPGRTLSLFAVEAAGLRPLARIDIGLGPSSAVSGDFNNDQRLDLAAAVIGESSVAVVLGAQ